MNYGERKLEDLKDLITRTLAWFAQIESTNFINCFMFQISNCFIYLIKRNHLSFNHICELLLLEESSYWSISFSSTVKRNRLSSYLNAWRELLSLKVIFFWNYYFVPKARSKVWNAILTKICSRYRFLNIIFISERIFSFCSESKNIVKYRRIQILVTFMHKTQNIVNI